MARPTVAEIDLQAFANNWKVITEIKEPDQLIPVLKANAYGHGSELLALQLQKWGAKQVAVAMIEEAEVIRKAGFQGPIFILGSVSREEAALAQQLNFIPLVGDKQNLLNLVAENFKTPIHLKWDTGMGRLGFAEEDIDWVKEILRKHPWLQVQALCTHFLKGEDLGQKQGFSEQQFIRFQKIEAEFPQISQRHIFNSDAFWANAERRRVENSYGARPGICLYGYTSVKNTWTQRLQPVMSLKTKIIHLSKVKPGQTVSYNATWTAQRDSLVAVVPIGYADGYPRSLSNKGQVFVRGKIVPLVGIVCMDYFMIDVTDTPEVGIGDEVELWGKNLPLEEVARLAGTITYELVTALTSRVPRVVKGESRLSGTADSRLD